MDVCLTSDGFLTLMTLAALESRQPLAAALVEEPRSQRVAGIDLGCTELRLEAWIRCAAGCTPGS